MVSVLMPWYYLDIILHLFYAVTKFVSNQLCCDWSFRKSWWVNHCPSEVRTFRVKIFAHSFHIHKNCTNDVAQEKSQHVSFKRFQIGLAEDVTSYGRSTTNDFCPAITGYDSKIYMKSFPEIPEPDVTPLSSLYQLPITIILVRPLCLIPAVIVLILSE